MNFSAPQRRLLTTVLAALITLKIALLFLLAWNRRIVMDEFAQLGWAKYLDHGLFDTVWPSKTVGFTVFIDLAHMLGWDARSILLIGRMETALLACGTLALIYASARSLGESKTRAALIVLVLLSFSNFIERIFETRAEPLATFFGAAALLIAVRAEDRGWRIVAAGALSGLAFLSTQKAIYFDVALGLALLGDAVLGRRYRQGVVRGAWLVLGWLAPVIAYCFAFGGSHPLAVAQNLVFGPLAVASPQTAAGYGGLRQFVVQTLVRNVLLYAFCFTGMALALLRLTKLGESRRIALIFSVVVTALIFAHNQPWPYVFVMALPFVALWAPRVFDALEAKPLYVSAAWAVLGIAVLTSFARNVEALRIDDHAQLALVDRAEKLVGPSEVYFDGVGMLPNRSEPSTLWLDRHAVLQTLREGQESEAYRIFTRTPPKVILWSYRTDAIEPVIDPLIRSSYVQVAPNIRMAGVPLSAGKAVTFEVPIADRYTLYDGFGKPVLGQVELNSAATDLPITLPRGTVNITLSSGPAEALLVPQGSYKGLFSRGSDNKELFAHVYD